MHTAYEGICAFDAESRALARATENVYRPDATFSTVRREKVNTMHKLRFLERFIFLIMRRATPPPVGGAAPRAPPIFLRATLAPRISVRACGSVKNRKIQFVWLRHAVVRK